MRSNVGIIVGQQALAGSCDPDLAGIGAGDTFGYMDMNRFKRFILICPKVDPVWTHSKDLRHSRILPLAKIP